MTQARRWLFLSAALVLLPSAALAQKKPGKGGAKPPTTAPAGAAPADADAPAGPADADATPAAPADAPATPPADTPAAGADQGICAITPDLPQCNQKATAPVDRAAEAKKSAKAEIYAVQQIYALRYHRFELEPYWSFSLNDQFVSHPGPGLAANFYLTNVLAIGLNGNWYGGLNVDSDFNFQNRRATRVAVPLNEYQWSAALNFTYVPMYGKFAGIGDFIFHYDAYVVGGVGMISTRPIPVIDPDNRNFKYEPKADVNLGIGLRVFLNRWFAVNAEIRDYVYLEQLESKTIATNQADRQNPNTWFESGTTLTNNVQAQIGVSIFLPFSWEYRLPK